MDSVYLVRCGNHKYYKIGYTTNFRQRIGTLQNGCPFKLHPIAVIPVQESKSCEALVLQKYEKHISIGEWMLLSEDQVQEIVNMIKKY